MIMFNNLAIFRYSSFLNVDMMQYYNYQLTFIMTTVGMYVINDLANSIFIEETCYCKYLKIPRKFLANLTSV